MAVFFQSGGWLMWPILLCSIAAISIAAERFWTLRPAQINPPGLVQQVWRLVHSNKLNKERIRELKQNSPMGEILAAGLINIKHGREVVKQSMDDKAVQVVHEFERFLNLLGSIAAITPLLGLLGTVIGMIRVFSAIMAHGTGDASILAGGISEALITTAAGLTVAIPSLFFHRMLTRRVDELSVGMEREAVKLIDALYGGREVEFKEGSEPEKNLADVGKAAAGDSDAAEPAVAQPEGASPGAKAKEREVDPDTPETGDMFSPESGSSEERGSN